MTQPDDHPAAVVVYLAQQGDPDTVTDLWAEMITGELSQDTGYHVYRPAEAWRSPAGVSTQRVEAINRVALIAADVVVALVPTHASGLELGLAIEAALAHEVPVVVVTNSSAVQRSLTGRPGVTVTRDADEAVPLIVRAVADAPLTTIDVLMRDVTGERL